MNNKRKIIAFIGILLGMSNSMIMQTILTTSLPVISEEFKTIDYYISSNNGNSKLRCSMY